MSGVDLNTVVDIKINTRKKVQKKASVLEAVKQKYIKVEIDDEDDHVFILKWNGSMYESTFLEIVITCQYNIKQDFSAIKTAQGSSVSQTIVTRSKGGRPESMR